MKMILLVPVVMACAMVGTIGMVLGIDNLFRRKQIINIWLRQKRLSVRTVSELGATDILFLPK